MSERLTPLRRKTLEHIQQINDGARIGARCPYAEMIREAEDCIQEGLSEWREDNRSVGRWITDAGRVALANPV